MVYSSLCVRCGGDNLLHLAGRVRVRQQAWYYIVCQAEHELPGHIGSQSVVAALPWDVFEGYTFEVGIELRHSRVSKCFDRSACITCIGSVYSRTGFRTTFCCAIRYTTRPCSAATRL